MDVLRQRHAELCREALRPYVVGVDDRDQLGQFELVEGVVSGRDGRFSCKAASPGVTGQPPAKLGTGRKFRQERWIADTDKSDELAARVALAGFDGPEAEAMGGPVVCDERVERANGCGVDRPVEVPSDLGVLV